jgi:malonate decarboxylase delta subunit
MESFSFSYPAGKAIGQRAHTGVVGSGDMEILIEPGTGGQTEFMVRTASDGFYDMWKSVIDRFMDHHAIDAKVTINDFGATPGVVRLRLAQAMELVNNQNRRDEQ